MKYILNTFFMALVAFSLSSIANAQQIAFSWDAPTERENGSALTVAEIAGYKLYKDGEYLMFIAGNQTTADYVFEGFGSPCFTLTTIDSMSQESRHSEQVCVDVFPALPAAPVLNVSF